MRVRLGGFRIFRERERRGREEGREIEKETGGTGRGEKQRLEKEEMWEGGRMGMFCSSSASLQARDGNSVCVALSGPDGKYVIINIQEGNVSPLSLHHTPYHTNLCYITATDV